jgi:hypothetical protein
MCIGTTAASGLPNHFLNFDIVLWQHFANQTSVQNILSSFELLFPTKCKHGNTLSGVPETLDTEELLAEVRGATTLMQDDALHSRPCAEYTDPSIRPSRGITDEDIRVLMQKHSFLADFSDTFICNTPIGDLMKIESTAMKAKEIERAKDSDDKLANNKAGLASKFTEVLPGRNNRWTHLHSSRFLGEATCLSAKLRLAARQAWGSTHHTCIRQLRHGCRRFGRLCVGSWLG